MTTEAQHLKCCASVYLVQKVSKMENYKNMLKYASFESHGNLLYLPNISARSRKSLNRKHSTLNCINISWQQNHSIIRKCFL